MEMVCKNGVWIPTKDVVIPLSNRAFRYGDSIFESFQIQSNSWLFFADHFQRLSIGAAKLGYQLPGNFQHQLTAALSKNPATSNNGFGRLMLFRNGEGKYAPTENTISWILEFKPTEHAGYPLQIKGLKIDISKKIVLNPGGLSNDKTGSALPYVIASQEKQEQGLDDLLLLNPARNIVESTNANIFVRKENQIYTPPLSQGCLAGVMRKQLIQLVQKTKEFELREEPISLHDLIESQEVWLTNASSGIRWVQSFRNRNFTNDQYDFWLGKLNELITPNK